MILITGATGQLGTAFRRLLPGGIFLTREELDLTDLKAIRPALDEVAPDVVINCAAYTAVDRAEDEEELAHLVNARAVGEMAAWCAGTGARFVTYSTDYVFDGQGSEPYLESDRTDPVNAYGRTKLAGERLAREAHPESLIIRTSWVVSGTHRNFVATILERAAQQELQVVDDQHGRPTVTDDLAAGTLGALERGAQGLLHLANQGVTTWFGLAREAVGLAGIDQDRVRPCSTEEYPTKAPRPAYSVLGSERLTELGLEPLPPWRKSLPRVVDELLARG